MEDLGFLNDRYNSEVNMPRSGDEGSNREEEFVHDESDTGDDGDPHHPNGVRHVFRESTWT